MRRTDPDDIWRADLDELDAALDENEAHENTEASKVAKAFTAHKKQAAKKAKRRPSRSKCAAEPAVGVS